MKKFLMIVLFSAMMMNLASCEKNKSTTKNPTNTESVTLGTAIQSSETPVDAPVLMATPNPNDEVLDGTLPPKPERTHELATLKPTDAVATEATTSKPTAAPTVKPTATVKPTVAPTVKPTATVKPTVAPTAKPTATVKPTSKPTAKPTVKPTATPTERPIPEITINSKVSSFYWCWDEVKEEYTELFYDRVIYYINKYRAEEGQAPAVKHTKISQVAEFRAWQSENFICGSSDPNHTCEPTVCGYQGHSHPASHISWCVAAEEFEYGHKDEITGNWTGVGEAYASSCGFYADTIDFAARRVTTGFHDSEGHWRYLGDEYNRYIGVGVAENGHDLFICVSSLDENLNDYHKIHNPNDTCRSHNCDCP